MDTNTARPDKQIAKIEAYTEGANASNRGGRIVFYTRSGTATTGTAAIERMRVTNEGRFIYSVPNSVPADSLLMNGFVSAWLDEGSSQLKFKVRDSVGNYKTGSVALSS